MTETIGDTEALFREVWELAFRRAVRPMAALDIPEEIATEVLQEVFLDALEEFPSAPSRSALSAFVLEKTRAQVLARVAAEREGAGDQDLFRPAGDRPYGANPHIGRLQRRDAEGGFSDPEWSKLVPVLEPLGFAALQKKGVPSEDAKDVFSETVAALVRGRAKDGKAPVELVTVFEELIPLFSTMLGHRVIDWTRRVGAQKNRPNSQHSLEELTENPDRPIQIADPDTVGGDALGSLSFEQIYYQCRECLSEFEWDLLHTVYVSRSATRGELLRRSDILEQLGLKGNASTAKRRRHLNVHLESALANLARCLGD